MKEKVTKKLALVALFILVLLIVKFFLFGTISTFFGWKENKENVQSTASLPNAISPKDEGKHQNLQTEWWYFAGHLEDKANSNNKFGITLMFSKNPPSVLFNLVDGSNQKNFSSFENFDKYDVLAENDLSIAIGKNYWRELSRGEYEINFETGDKKANLKLKSLKNPLIYFLSGNEFYYQQTRLDVVGDLSFGEKQYDIVGLGWIDHQGFEKIMPWKSWGWHSLQLNNNTEIVFSTNLALQTGGISEKSRLIIFKDNKEILSSQDYQIKDLEYWVNQDTGIRYPVKWDLVIPNKKANLIIEALTPNQTVKHSDGLAIYEGTCLVSGTFDGQTVTGRSQFEFIP